MTKIYALFYDVGPGGCMGPMPFRGGLPPGVELIEVPGLSCDEKGAHLRLVVRCEPEIGKRMGWIPAERPSPPDQL